MKLSGGSILVRFRVDSLGSALDRPWSARDRSAGGEELETALPMRLGSSSLG